MIKQIKLKSAYKKRKKLLANYKHKPKLNTFELAQKIAIIYPFETKEEYDEVYKLIKDLKEKIGFRTVASLGYIESKKMPEYVQITNSSIITNTNSYSHNLYPKSEEITSFINQSFDILIDLSQTEIIPLQFVVILSKSKLKIGYANIENSNYDLMIEIDKQQSSHSEYIIEIQKYLNILK